MKNIASLTQFQSDDLEFETDERKEDSPHYTVDYGYKEDDAKRRYYIILYDGIPIRYANSYLVKTQEKQGKSVSTDAYYLCDFLNTVENDGLSVHTIDLEYIRNYLSKKYNEDHKSASVVLGYIRAIEGYYEYMAKKNASMDPSLLIPRSGVVILYPDTKLTTIGDLKSFYLSEKKNKPSAHSEKLPADISSSKYAKRYTKAQVDAISDLLPLVDRCMFLDTLFTGHSIESVLELRLGDFNPVANTIFAHHTRTGRSHVAPIPNSLTNLINTYIIEERSRITERTGSTSDYLFLNRDGTPRSYSAFYASLKRVEKQLKKERPELQIDALHPYTGRSTFIAITRNSQLKQRRLKQPTFSDFDILVLMDWSSFVSLEEYDRINDSLPPFVFE